MLESYNNNYQQATFYELYKKDPQRLQARRHIFLIMDEDKVQLIHFNIIHHYLNYTNDYANLNIFSTLIFKRNYSTSGKRLTKVERASISLSTDIQEALIGILLGDGHIAQRSPVGNSRFHYTQSAPLDHHVSYFNHVYHLFKPYCANDFTPKIRSSKHNLSGNIHISYSFTTLSLPIFNKYREMYYKEGVKVIPTNIKELLIYRSLAYWIMDDGSKHNKGLHLNTYSFKLEEVIMLSNIITEKFNLLCTIHLHKDRPRIYIPESSMFKLTSNLIPFMHESMVYKLGL